MKANCLYVTLTFASHAVATSKLTDPASLWESADNLTSNLVDKFVDRALAMGLMHHADLDDTTLGKPAQVAIPMEVHPYVVPAQHTQVYPANVKVQKLQYPAPASLMFKPILVDNAHAADGMDMKGMDMKGMDMKGMDMKGMDMKGMDMKGMDMNMDMEGKTMKEKRDMISKSGMSMSSGGDIACPNKFGPSVFVDMKDGDMKEVTIDGKTMTIKPYGNDQKWVVNTNLNLKPGAYCTAPAVDFNVPGKPGYPPVPVTATLWSSAPATGTAAPKKAELEFTDFTGKLVKDNPFFPLNRWVQLGTDGETTPGGCPTKMKDVYQDLHDGDMKMVTIDGTSMQITPFNNGQKWTAKGKLDSKSCSAMIDFNVEGKPDPPPVQIKATLLETKTSSTKFSKYQYTGPDGREEEVKMPLVRSRKLTQLEFTDPSGTLASKDFPLNHWVQYLKPLTPNPPPK